jgi:hypothetical protein
MDKDLKDYRKHLIETSVKLNENYDKLVITLSGGALALSLTFLKDIIKEKPVSTLLLYWSWGLLIGSLTCVLGALLFGIAAHEKAIKQVDADSIYHESVGGWFSYMSTTLHYLGTILLVAGLVCMTIFVDLNMEVTNVKGKNTTATENAAKTTGSEKTGFYPGKTR